MVTEEKIRDRCPNCGSEDIETAVHQYRAHKTVLLDVGWRCRKCLHEWGFEEDSQRKDR
jgi:predicted RNA-binding Zn-ribbon protein involved in translation (DUF1610 family)